MFKLIKDLNNCRKNIFNVCKKIKEERITRPNPNPGRNRSVRTKRIIEAFKKRVKKILRKKHEKDGKRYGYFG